MNLRRVGKVTAGNARREALNAKKALYAGKNPNYAKKVDSAKAMILSLEAIGFARPGVRKLHEDITARVKAKMEADYAKRVEANSKKKTPRGVEADALCRDFRQPRNPGTRVRARL